MAPRERPDPVRLDVALGGDLRVADPSPFACEPEDLPEVMAGQRALHVLVVEEIPRQGRGWLVDHAALFLLA
ncbi:hypothetical protein [Streptomyces sp. NPDC086776]|uniref:hypothetical protein n=1 Tax=Streptomyces sp. NPDC086776 TaxID=3365756 RepID=UPI0038207E7C